MQHFDVSPAGSGNVLKIASEELFANNTKSAPERFANIAIAANATVVSISLLWPDLACTTSEVCNSQVFALDPWPCTQSCIKRRVDTSHSSEWRGYCTRWNRVVGSMTASMTMCTSRTGHLYALVSRNDSISAGRTVLLHNFYISIPDRHVRPNSA